ncbi:hypothetical protein V8E52_006045 [Russula decolorans]
MSFFRKNKHSPSNSAPANRLASQSRASQQPQYPTESQSQSQSHSQSHQQTQQSQPLYPWSAHTSSYGQSPSPFLRNAHSLSTSATAGGELFLFGGYVHGSRSPSNELYVLSTLNFSTTPLRTSGDIPSPRYAHRAVLTSTILFIWGGGGMNFVDLVKQNQALDDSLYLLNLVSREWTRIVVNGPGPSGRYYHAMTLVGSKLFVFGGMSPKRDLNDIWALDLNDIWALDLNSLKSNPFWESYEPALGNEKPPARAGHVSVTTGDRIIIFGGRGDLCHFNDTWSFNISTRKWTELQCAGSIPSPRVHHAAVLVDDVMYVFGGLTANRTKLGDLTALNLSTQRWTAFKDIGPSPCRRRAHALASDGRRVFVLGGELSLLDEDKLIHVLDTSTYFLFVISFAQPSSLKQSYSFTRNPTPILSSIVRRPTNLRRSYPRVTRPTVNRNIRHSHHRTRMSTQNIVLLLFEKLPPEDWTTPPLCGLLTIEPPVRMTSHRYSRAWMINQDVSRKKTTIAKVRQNLM